MGRIRGVTAGVVALAVVIGLVWGLHNAVAQAAVRTVALAYGYKISFAQFELGVARAKFVGAHVETQSGDPVFDAQQIDLGYSLRDLLPGGAIRFGLRNVDVSRPQLTLIHYPDGTYNVRRISISAPQKQKAAPFNMRLRVRDGSVALIDRYTAYPKERRQRLEGIAVDGVLSPTEHSFYKARLDLNDGHRLYPMLGTATFDDARGYESQHWVARRLPIGPLVDFVLSSHAVNLTAGDLDDLDVRLFSLADASGALQPHIAARAGLNGAKIYFAGLQKPLRDGHGELYVYDDGITVPRLDGKITDVPIVAAGGIYDFTSPMLRLGMRGAGDLSKLRRVASGSENRPVAGPLAFQLLAEGPLQKPLVLAAFQSPAIAYRTLNVNAAHGLIAVLGPRMDVIGAAMRYGPVGITLRGSMLLQRQLSATLVAFASGPSDRLPYTAQIVPHMPLRGVAVIQGVDRSIAFDGVIDGASRSQQLAGVASVAPDGTGSVGPITIDGPNAQSLYARVELDRPHDRSMIVVSTHHLTVHPGSIAALPGLPSKRLPRVDGTVDSAFVGLQHGAGLEYLAGDAAVAAGHVGGVTIDRVLAQGTYTNGNLDVLADLHGNASALRRFGVPLSAGRLNAIAHLGGTLSAPQATVDALLFGGKLARSPVAGNAALAYANDKLQIQHSTVMVGGAYGIAKGTVSGLRSGSPRYDVVAQMRAGDVATLSRAFHLDLPYPTGTIDADVQLGGAGSNPSFVGDVDLPEASLNGLAFHGRTRFAGTPAGIVTRDGSLVVGSTALRFNGALSAGRQAIDLRGSAVDLSDFNDYFDAADTLHGRGSVELSLNRSAGALQSSGDLAIKGARFRRLPIGDATAHWSTSGDTVIGTGDVHGQGGQLHVAGSARVASARNSSVNLTAAARNLDLGVWLPAAGYTAPIVGFIDADARVIGPLAMPSFTTNAALRSGIVAGVPINRFTVAASASDGQARVASAVLDIPNLAASASGTLGFAAGSPLNLTAQASARDIGALAKTLGKNYPIGGSFRTSVRITGTRLNPIVADTLDLTDFHYNAFQVPRIHAEVAVARDAIDVRNGTINLQKGSLSFAGHLPKSIAALAFVSAVPTSPISGRLDARAVDLAQFSTRLPKGTKLGGVIDGAVDVGGTYTAPLLDGALALSRGYYSSPDVATPLTNGSGGLAFAGTGATISRMHVDVGGGTIDTNGTVKVADLRDPLHALSYDVATQANHAVFNVPKFFRGQIDGNLTATQPSGGSPLIGGNLTISRARVPLTAILAEALAKPSNAKPPPIRFDTHVAIGPDVRVQSPNVDVGAVGSLALAGTLAAPQMSGTIASTGGTVDFYRDFTIQSGIVSFSGDSLIPDLNAVATTFLPQSSTEVRLRVTGPANDLNLALSSNPPHDRTQILGLLIGGPSFAGLTGLQTAQGPAPTPFLQSIPQGYVNQLFTRNILEPLQTSLGTALGLQNIQFNYDLAGQGGFSAYFRRGMGKNMFLSFATTYGFPSRTTIGLTDRLNNDSALRFTIFNTYGLQGLGYYSPYLLSQPGTNISLQASQPAAGENGFSLHYVRHFK